MGKSDDIGNRNMSEEEVPTRPMKFYKVTNIFTNGHTSTIHNIREDTLGEYLELKKEIHIKDVKVEFEREGEVIDWEKIKWENSNE